MYSRALPLICTCSKNSNYVARMFWIGNFHFISFHIFMEGGPSVIADLQEALRLHYTYIPSKRKIITNMKPNYNA